MRRRLDHLVQSDPRAAIVEATTLLREVPDDPLSGLHAWATIGRALYELGDMRGAPEAMREALRSADRAVAVPDAAADLPVTLLSGVAGDAGVATVAGAERTSDDDALAAVRLSAAIVFAEAGELADALEQLATAEATASGSTLGRVRTQRAFILCHAGRLAEALAEANLAEADLRRSRDRLGRLRLLVNRSLINLQLGDLGAAEMEMRKAHRAAVRLDQAVTAALLTANLGVVHARAGRTLDALEHFDRARRQYEAAGRPLRTMAILEVDRAETLLRAGLFGDAVAAAHLGVAHARASGNQVSIGDALLVLARTELADGRAHAAARTAADAARILHAGGRAGVAAQARAVGLQAALAAAPREHAPALLARARRLAGRLQALGCADMAGDLRLARLRCAHRLGLLDLAVDDLDALRRDARSRRADVAVRGWYAETLARLREGDQLRALRAARCGMSLVERHRDAAESYEHRAGWSAIGSDLADVAVRLSVRGRRPATVFQWAERTRAHAFRPDVLVAQPAPRSASLGTVEEQLAGRRMVEYVACGDELLAVVLGRGRTRLVELGPLPEVERASAHLRSSLHRAALPGGRDDLARVQQLARRLDELLVAPLGLRAGDEPDIVPVGPLHGVPWAALPGLASLAFSVTGSAEVWRACDRRAVGFRAGRVALLIGPGVESGRVERAAITDLHPDATVVRGARATADRLRTLLASADVVQIAAHGRFDGDQPLRSSLLLAGGEMTLTQLAAARVESRLVVLSSCEGGAHGGGAANEALGLASLLLARGAASVLAPLVVVSDAACASFVADVQRAWAAGAPIGAALAAVRAAWLDSPSPARWSTAASFLCFGTGALVAG